MKPKYILDWDQRLVRLCKKWGEAREEGTSITYFAKAHGMAQTTFKKIYGEYEKKLHDNQKTQI